MRLRSLVFGVSSMVLAACSAVPPEEESAASDEALLQEMQLTLDESALDRSVKPCDDFFQFACGGYLKTVPVESEDDLHDRAFDSVSKANEDALDAILAETKAHPATALDERLNAFYGSCKLAKKSPRNDPAQIAYLRAGGDAINRLRATGGLGKALAELALRGTKVPFVGLLAYGDMESDATKTAFFVGPASKSTLVTDAEPLSKKLDKLYPNEAPEARAQRVQTILGIEQAIAKTLMGGDNKYHPIGRAGLLAVLPHIDWTGLLAQLGIPRAKRINVVNINALAKIDEIIANTPDDAMGVYLDYKLADSLSGGLNAGIPGATDEFAEAAAKLLCDVTLASAAPGLVMNKFVEATVDPKSERMAKAMTRAIFKAFEKRLAANDLLDAATRVEALGKVRGMLVTPLRQKVDTFEGVTFKPDSYLDNWEAMTIHRRTLAFRMVDKAVDRTALEGGLDANAFYAPDQNRIEIQPGILHGVFFGTDAPRVLNFGALGWVIGHETTHGFDDSGRLFDARGTRRDWWSPSVTQAFEEKARCFVEQYGAFEVPEAVDPETHAPRRIDGELTLGENIADNGGIRVAYDAAEPYFASSKSIAGFTPEQQFFIAGAQTWCGNMGAKAADSILSDAHSPNKARVNVTYSNFDRFARAFQCAAGDKMIAAKACKLW